ncbi:eCIS core domain-containing protein [Chitinimonas naiadis]
MSALAQTHKAAEAAAVAHARKGSKPAGPALLPRQRLRLGGAQDEAEHQAERIADRVTSAPAKLPAGATAKAGGAISNATSAVRRALSHHADTQVAEAQDHTLQREEGRRTDDDKLLPEPLEARLLALLQGGDPLPDPTRRLMEQRFGMSLASVRIHTDGEAASLNEAVGAHAFTLGEHIAFNRGRFQPDHPAGEHLLAHELAHVAQHRAQADAIETAPVRRGFWSDLYDSAASTLGDIADWAWDKVQEFGWELLESIAPEFARTVRTIQEEGILPWLGRQVARAWDGFIGGLRALVPFEGPQQLITLFAGLVERAAGIVVALASGNCEPLMAAITELKTFVVETAGVAWNKLTEFLAPIGTFFTDLWNSFGAPAVQWLQDFGGAVWEGIQDLGRRFWEWIRPVREAAERIWNWFSELLFGSGDTASGNNEGGVLGWITRKAGEAWDWVKEQTRPVWQPVAEFAAKVAELIPPAFIREMGENAQQLSTQLNDAGAGMEGGDGVADNRDTLASVLPSVETIIATIRRIIVGAGAWLTEKVGDIGTAISGLISRLSTNALLSWLGSAFTWLADLVTTLTTWAQQQVSGLFNLLVQGFDALSPFLQLVLETVRKVISIYADILQLPILILNSIWQRVPECIRVPIENFIQNQILARIPVFGQFFSDPELWPRVRDTALRILRRLFVDGDIAGAAWLFFQSILRILGLPPELVIQVLAKAAAAIGDILTNPIGFLINLVRTMGAGFMRFFGNIGTHLLNGLTGWLFGALREAGIQPPTDFSLGGILGFVMEVLGITVDNIFSRLSERIGAETTARLRRMLDVATGVWSFVSVLITEGPAGLWRELTERLSTLWDQVVEGVTGFITERVIGWATRWLTSLLDVTGIMPAINTIIAIYNAIQSFIEYLRELLEIVSRVLDGINSIARGDVEPGAEIMEGALGAAMPIAIGFLANQAGLGRLSARLREILAGLQERVNGAIDWVIDRAIRLGQSLLDMARRGVAAVRNWWEARRGFHAEDGEEHNVYLEGTGSSTHLMVASGDPTNYSEFIRAVDVPANKRADKAEATRIAGELDTAIRAAAAARVGAPARGSGGGRGAGAAAADPAAEIDRLLGQLAVVTARFMPSSGNSPSTLPVYGGTNGAGYGSSATVLRLTHNRSFTGSAPSRSLHTPAYTRLNQRRSSLGATGSYYVLGHLLNHNLGGPGTTWTNLTPLSQGANNRRDTSMLHGFEKLVKDAVDADRPANRKIVNFVVTANYNMPSRTSDANRALANARAARTDAEKRRWLAVREVVQEEASVPNNVSLIAHTLRPDGTRDAQIGSGDAVENIPSGERDINQYGVSPRDGILEDHRSEL